MSVVILVNKKKKQRSAQIYIGRKFFNIHFVCVCVCVGEGVELLFCFFFAFVSLSLSLFFLKPLVLLNFSSSESS